MNDLSPKERAFLVLSFHEHHKCLSSTLSEFREKFGRESEITYDDTLLLYNNFLEEGEVISLSSPPNSQEEKLKQVKDYFDLHPDTTIIKASEKLNIPKDDLQIILNEKLKIFNYKITLHQNLSNSVYSNRVIFANKLIAKFKSNSIKKNKMWIVDEATFEINGDANKKNFRIWGTSKPKFTPKKTLHPEKITVLVALSTCGIAGPYFIKDNFTGKTYKEHLEKHFIPFCKRHNALEDFWFFQDGASQHRTVEVFELLQEHFSTRVVGLNYPAFADGGLEWPPYSPDLNPCDFFLWGYVKDKVYEVDVPNMNTLVQRIKDCCSKIPLSTLNAVFDSFYSRIQHIQKINGDLYENFIN